MRSITQSSCANSGAVPGAGFGEREPPELLDRVRTHGDWEAWLGFYLDGVRSVADGAVDTAERISLMLQENRAAIQQKGGRRAGSALRVHDALAARPILSMPKLAKITGLTFPTVSSALELLGELGIVRELTGKRRNRLFAYDRYLAVLSEGTEPL